MDRFPPPFLGRKRGWILIGQVALFAVTLWLAGVSSHPEAVWVIGALALAIAFASATQDIAIDAYAVEVLRRDEQGFASGARTAFYRAAMLVAGGVAITLAAETSWTFVNALLALLYLPFMVVTVFAPEPESLPEPPRTLQGSGVGAVRGLPRPAPVARDPLLRGPLQARRQPDPVADRPLPDPDRLQRLRRRPGPDHDRPGRGHRGHADRRDPRPTGWASAGRCGSSGSCSSCRTWATRRWRRSESTGRSCTRRRPSSWARAASGRGPSACCSCASRRRGSPRPSTRSSRASSRCPASSPAR